MKTLALVILAGLLFSLGDVMARNWGKSLEWSWFVGMAIVGTMAYSVFGYLARDTEFSRVAIWVSISLTICSVTVAVLFYGDPITNRKLLAILAALVAAYFSSHG